MKPKNILELRDSLLEEIEALKKDPQRRLHLAKETFNGAGKIINATVFYAEEAFRHGVANDDPFLGNLANVPVPKSRRAMMEIEYSQFKKQLPEKTEEL